MQRCTIPISIHAPAKGATSPCPVQAAGRLNFNPRSREGSDAADDHGHSDRAISIHAPAKGATAACCISLVARVISIHAPAKGATRCAVWFALSAKHFNPRSREGSDFARPRPQFRYGDFNPRSREGSDRIGRFEIEGMDISIHAPAKGATLIISGAAFWRSFQSTLPRRERLSPLSVLQFCLPFQSTLPRRERPP